MSNHRIERRQRRRSRGFGLIEIVVTIAIIAMISAGVTVGVVKAKVSSERKMTKTNAETIRHGVKTWWMEHDVGTCPSVKDLVADGTLDRGKVDVDAWGQPWRIKCDERDVTIVSLGPDKLPDTEDDIRVPPG